MGTTSLRYVTESLAQPEPSVEPVLVRRLQASGIELGNNEKPRTFFSVSPQPVPWMEGLPEELWMLVLGELTKQAPQDAFKDLNCFARTAKNNFKAVGRYRESISDPRLDLLASRQAFHTAEQRALSSLAFWQWHDRFEKELKDLLAPYCAARIDNGWAREPAIKACMAVDSINFLHLESYQEFSLIGSDSSGARNSGLAPLEDAALSRLRRGKPLPKMFLAWDASDITPLAEMLNDCHFAPCVTGLSTSGVLRMHGHLSRSSYWESLLSKVSALRYLHIDGFHTDELLEILVNLEKASLKNLEELHLTQCGFCARGLVAFLGKLPYILPTLNHLTLDVFTLDLPKLSAIERAIVRSLKKKPQLTIALNGLPIRPILTPYVMPGRIITGEMRREVFEFPELYSRVKFT